MNLPVEKAVAAERISPSVCRLASIKERVSPTQNWEKVAKAPRERQPTEPMRSRCHSAGSRNGKEAEEDDDDDDDKPGNEREDCARSTG